MRVRGLLATTALAATTVVTAATADEAQDETCLLVQDAANDTTFQDQDATSGFLVQRDIDVTSADVATTKDNLHAVIRVQALDARPPTLYAQGQTTYRVEFTSGTRRLFVQVPTGFGNALSPTRYSWPYGATAGRVGGRPFHVRSRLDYLASEVTVDAPLSVFGRGAVAPGTTLSGFVVNAVRTYSDNGQLAPGLSSRVIVSDTATSKATYTAAAPSCVTPEEEPAPEEPGEPLPTEESPAPRPEPTEDPTPSPEPAPEPEPEPEPEPTDDPAPTADESLEPEPSDAPSTHPDEVIPS